MLERRARRPDQPRSRHGASERALLELLAPFVSLCTPLYAFVRRRGVPAEDARDLTREFFARLLSNAWLHDVNPGRGRFRSWLIASMKHFLANEWDKARAQKRGGGLAFYELDAQTAEGRYAIEPADGFSAEKLYDRRRALTPLDRTLERLGEEMAQSGRLKQFESLKFCLSGERGPSYAAVAPGTPLARCKSPLAAAKK